MCCFDLIVVKMILRTKYRNINKVYQRFVHSGV